MSETPTPEASLTAANLEDVESICEFGTFAIAVWNCAGVLMRDAPAEETRGWSDWDGPRILSSSTDANCFAITSNGGSVSAEVCILVYIDEGNREFVLLRTPTVPGKVLFAVSCSV